MSTRKPDIFATLPPAERAELMRHTCLAVFGDTVGARLWKQMEPVVTYDTRQLGDHLDPAQNYWGGLWRIHEVE